MSNQVIDVWFQFPKTLPNIVGNLLFVNNIFSTHNFEPNDEFGFWRIDIK